jgi:hypothetical protein
MGTCGAEDPSVAASSRAINGCDRVIEGITPSPMMGGLVAAWCWHCPADVGSAGEFDLIASAPMMDGFMPLGVGVLLIVREPVRACWCGAHVRSRFALRR